MLWSELNRAGWDPFTELRQLQTEMNRAFQSAGVGSAATYPPINLWLGENSLVVTAELPGLSREAIDITVAEDTLTIRGEHTLSANDNELGWHRRERPTGSFSRAIQLPFRVDAERIQARFQDGVLEIEMQRPDKDLPRKVEIKTA